MSSDTRTDPDRSIARPVLSPVAAVGLAIGAIWLAVAVIAVFAPDMVTGSQHEHLPLAGMTVWVWAVIASGYVAMSGRGASAVLLVGTIGVWLAAAFAAVAAPVMVTGTDPTRIPLGALLAPLLAAFATGFLALHDAREQGRR